MKVWFKSNITSLIILAFLIFIAYKVAIKEKSKSDLRYEQLLAEKMKSDNLYMTYKDSAFYFKEQRNKALDSIPKIQSYYESKIDAIANVTNKQLIDIIANGIRKNAEKQDK